MNISKPSIVTAILEQRLKLQQALHPGPYTLFVDPILCDLFAEKYVDRIMMVDSITLLDRVLRIHGIKHVAFRAGVIEGGMLLVPDFSQGQDCQWCGGIN